MNFLTMQGFLVSVLLFLLLGRLFVKRMTAVTVGSPVMREPEPRIGSSRDWIRCAQALPAA